MVDTLYSTSITALDPTTPPVDQPTTGQGAPGYAKVNTDYVTATTAGLKSTSSLYYMLRLPTTASLKSLKLINDTALDSSSPSLAWDVGAYYSSSTVDGTNWANQGAQISATCFGSAVTGYAAGETDVLTNFGAAKRVEALWQALGIGVTESGVSEDPGGFIDIVLAVHTAGSTSAAGGVVALQATYVD